MIHLLLIVASLLTRQPNSADLRRQCSPAPPSIPHASPYSLVPYWPGDLKENPDATSNSSSIDSSTVSRHPSGSPAMPCQNRHQRHSKTGNRVKSTESDRPSGTYPSATTRVYLAANSGDKQVVLARELAYRCQDMQDQVQTIRQAEFPIDMIDLTTYRMR